MYICDGVCITCVVQMYVRLFVIFNVCGVYVMCCILYLQGIVLWPSIEGLLLSHCSYMALGCGHVVSTNYYFVFSFFLLLIWKTLFTSVIYALNISFMIIQKILVLLYDHSVQYSIMLVIDVRVILMNILFWNKFELLSCVKLLNAFGNDLNVVLFFELCPFI